MTKLSIIYRVNIDRDVRIAVRSRKSNASLIQRIAQKHLMKKQ